MLKKWEFIMFVKIVSFLLFISFLACSPGDETNSLSENSNSDGTALKSDSDEGFVLPDASEGMMQNDSDVDNHVQTPWDNEDDDKDGIKNIDEGKGDADKDGIPNYKDTDSDGDGIPDKQETPNGVLVDTDQDGTPDFLDDDSDGDGIKDKIEGTDDADQDGIPNYRDTDSDDDGINDGIEAGVNPDEPVDSDDDGTPDYLDTDSDNDGILDIYEGINDIDKDGKPNFLDDDSDGDGILDKDEKGPDVEPVDTDKDGTPDFLDTDSDNDGLSDSEEIKWGSDPTKVDTDGDGFDDNTEHAIGSDPNDPSSGIPEGQFYVILPFEDPVVNKNLIFSTDIAKADILFLIDLSGSMGQEHSNLKKGIKDVIIDGVKAKIPDVGFGLVKFGTIEDKVYNLTQKITTDESKIKSAIDSISSCGGSEEYHTNALYEAATGDERHEEFTETHWIGSDDHYYVNISKVSCPAGTFGGACFREGALPIFIMASDEGFGSGKFGFDKHSGNASITMQNAIDAMNSIKAKFIGIDSGASMTSFNTVSTGTKSVDSSSNPFNYKISSDGSGMSNKIVDAVIALTSNIEIDLSTVTKSIANSYGVSDTTKFIKKITPVSADPANGATISGNIFTKVHPGTKVTFKIDFQNDFFENTDTASKLFKAEINVLGSGAFLDKRNVYIIVPGKKSGSEH